MFELQCIDTVDARARPFRGVQPRCGNCDWDEARQ